MFLGGFTSVPSARVIFESITPHTRSASGRFSEVNTHKSSAFTSLTLESAAMFAMSDSACAFGLHVGYGAVSRVAALQSSSTPLPGYSSAPGFTSSGVFEQVSEGESQQSPSEIFQPSLSASISTFGVVVVVVVVVVVLVVVPPVPVSPPEPPPPIDDVVPPPPSVVELVVPPVLEVLLVEAPLPPFPPFPPPVPPDPPTVVELPSLQAIVVEPRATSKKLVDRSERVITRTSKKPTLRPTLEKSSTQGQGPERRSARVKKDRTTTNISDHGFKLNAEAFTHGATVAVFRRPSALENAHAYCAVQSFATIGKHGTAPPRDPKVTRKT